MPAPATGPRGLAAGAAQEPHAAVNEAMSRLVALALSCDLTRVFSFMFSGSVGETSYWEVGQDKSHHQFTHDEPGDQPLVHAATVFVMQQFARLLETLKATPDGAGNLLDSSVILASSDTADARGARPEGLSRPDRRAGAAGALKYPGVHYRSDTEENTSKVLLTVLRAAGLHLPTFGAQGRRRRREPDRHRSLTDACWSARRRDGASSERGFADAGLDGAGGFS